MRQLYGRANSSNVMKVIWLLEELGLPYERIDAGLSFGVVDTPEYRHMNPNGIVPTLREDGFVLWESNAILRYLAATHDEGRRFWPQDPHSRAHVDQWMDWQQTVVNTPQSVVFQGLVRQTVAQRNMAAISEAAEKVGRAYSLLDAAMVHRAYVAGARAFAGGLHAGHPRPPLVQLPARPARPAASAGLVRPVAGPPALRRTCRTAIELSRLARAV